MNSFILISAMVTAGTWPQSELPADWIGFAPEMSATVYAFTPDIPFRNGWAVDGSYARPGRIDGNVYTDQAHIAWDDLTVTFPEPQRGTREGVPMWTLETGWTETIVDVRFEFPTLTIAAFDEDLRTIYPDLSTPLTPISGAMPAVSADAVLAHWEVTGPLTTISGTTEIPLSIQPWTSYSLEGFNPWWRQITAFRGGTMTAPVTLVDTVLDGTPLRLDTHIRFNGELMTPEPSGAILALLGGLVLLPRLRRR